MLRKIPRDLDLSSDLYDLSPVGSDDLWRTEVAVVGSLHAHVVLDTLVKHRLCVAAPSGEKNRGSH